MSISRALSGAGPLAFAVFILAGEGWSAESIVHLKDGTDIKGEIVAENEETVQVKVRFGTVTLERKEIKAIESARETEAAAAGKDAEDTFRNGFLEYAISRPGRTWVFKKCPPEPLVDLVIYNARHEAEVSVLVLPDENPDVELVEENLELFLRAIEHKLKEKYRKITKISSEASPFKELAAYKARYDVVSKLNGRPYVFRYYVFKAKRRLYSIYNAAPTALFAGVESELERIVGSFDFIEAKEFEGNVYSNFEHLYGAAKPASWKFSRSRDGSTFAAPDGRAEFVVTARSFFRKESLAKLAADREKELAASLRGFHRTSSRPVNMLSTVVQELRYRDETPGGARETREIIVLSDTRLYFAQARHLSSAAAAHGPVLRKTMGSLAVQRDLTSKATIEEGIRAIELFDSGDKEVIKKRFDEAIDFYLAAISRFRNFAYALNNLGVTYNRKDDARKFFDYAQKAHNLFPEHVTLRKNLGTAYALAGIEKTKRGQYTAAIRDFEKALKYNPEAKEFEKNLAIAHFNEGVGRANEGLFAAAAGSISRALKLDPGNHRYKTALSVAYYNLAAGYVVRRQFTQAINELNRSLKVNPKNSKAKVLLKQLKQITRR